MPGRLLPELIPLPAEYAARYDGARVGRGSNWTWPCHLHGGSDSLSVHVEGRWNCFACGAKGGDMLDLHAQVHGLSITDAARELGAWQEGDEERREPAARSTPAEAPARPVAARAQGVRTLGPGAGAGGPSAAPPASEPMAYVRDILRASQPLAGTAAERYLLNRHCALPPADGDLRYIASLPHRPSGTAHPAMLAPITDAITGQLIGVHRTYLRADGTGKADVTPARMILGRAGGGVVRLWPDEAVTAGLAVAEGIESALAMAHAFRPAWACLSAGGMVALPVLEGIESLTIAVDHDPAGIAAAHTLAARWHAAGREVRIVMPEREGADLNDLVLEAAS